MPDQEFAAHTQHDPSHQEHALEDPNHLLPAPQVTGQNFDESHPANPVPQPDGPTRVPHQPSAEDDGHHGAPIVIDTNARMGRGPLLLVILLGVVVVVVIVMLLLHRSAEEHSLQQRTNAASVPDVAVTYPKEGANAKEIRLPADTQAYIDTSIYSRTNGYLKKWYADIGTVVRKGQLLAVIETPEVDQQVQQAIAGVATAKANEELAVTTNDRWKALLAKNAVSRQEADQTASDLLVRQSNLEAAQANLRRLQQLQSFERIYAPFDGVITVRNVDIGSLIQAGDSNVPHSELFHINSLGLLRMFVPVPEVYVPYVQDGERVEVTTDAYPGEIFHGTLTRNATAIDIQSRTLRVEVDVNNPSNHLLPGQYSFVHLPIPPSANAMTLPANTVLFRADGLRVGVVENGRVRLQPVTIGHDYGATVEITSGLKPTDQVILNPSDSLFNGELVNVVAK